MPLQKGSSEMSDYEKQQLLITLAREALGIRQQRIAMRKERLERSKNQLEVLEDEFARAKEIVNGPSRVY
jgi:hypothetical protein